jgi:hypothetical protein
MCIVSVTAGSRLLGYDFTSASPMGEKECFRLCSHHTDCLSINYSKTRLLCELNSQQESDNVKVTKNGDEAEDFIYTSRQSIPQVCSNISRLKYSSSYYSAVIKPHLPISIHGQRKKWRIFVKVEIQM